MKLLPKWFYIMPAEPKRPAVQSALGKKVEDAISSIMAFVLLIGIFGAIVFGMYFGVGVITETFGSAFPQASENLSKALPWIIGVIVAQVAWGRLQKQFASTDERMERMEKRLLERNL